MSLRPDGTYRCDKCGADVGNAGVVIAAFVSDLDPESPGMIRSLHFCRDRDGVTGCVFAVLSDANLQNYIDTKGDPSHG